MKKLMYLLLAAVLLSACTPKQKDENAGLKTLVLYYSQSGTTEKLAQELQSQLNADIEEIVAEIPYDGDFNATIERCKKEMEAGEVPAIKALQHDIADYDQVFLCYPVWFGTYAMPIAGLVKNCDFAGKMVVACCTFGSGGLQASTQALKDALPEANVVEGFGIRQARIEKVADELGAFLVANGYKEGVVEELPAYGERHAVSEEEYNIFNEACGDYQFPLGNPIDVAVRETSSSTDYDYNVESMGMDGEATMVTIYVTKGKQDGDKAEFTQVVR